MFNRNTLRTVFIKAWKSPSNLSYSVKGARSSCPIEFEGRSGKSRRTPSRRIAGAACPIAQPLLSHPLAGLPLSRRSFDAERRMPEASVQGAANERRFETRIEAVRRRFAAKFIARMQVTAADLSRMTGEGSAPANIVASTYRWLHEVCGIASTIGFDATGRSARSCDTLLVGPCRARRGLSAEELAQLTELLDVLRRAAQAEMQILDSNRG